jgi:hypothetical protein
MRPHKVASTESIYGWSARTCSPSSEGECNKRYAYLVLTWIPNEVNAKKVLPIQDMFDYVARLFAGNFSTNLLAIPFSRHTILDSVLSQLNACWAVGVYKCIRSRGS